MLKETNSFVLLIVIIVMIMTLLTFLLTYTWSPPEDDIPRRSRPVFLSISYFCETEAAGLKGCCKAEYILNV